MKAENIREVKLADNALVSWETAKAELESNPFVPPELDLEHVQVKNYIIGMINSISSQVELLVGRELGKKERKERLVSGTSLTISLRHFPIKEVSSISLVSRGGIEEYPINSEAVLALNDEGDLQRGSLYIDRMLVPSSVLVGLGGGHVAEGRRNMLITYTAGYTLPQQATEEEPSDLPPAITGIILDVLSREFGKKIDQTRSEDLIQLQEGNVSRMWGTSTDRELAKSGYFTKAEQDILKALGPKRVMFTV